MPVAVKDLLHVARQLHFPQENRRSVRRNDSDKKKGFMLGYVINYASGWTASRYTRKYPEFAQMLCDFAHRTFPSFKFTSIMVNQGSSSLHVDALNCGKSLIMAFGDHTGGDLWQYPGKTIKIRNRLRECDGRLPHITMPFEGERFSVVYFNLMGNRKACSRADRAFLHELGFSSPSERGPCEGGARKDLLPSAAAILKQDYGLSAKYIGDYANKNIKQRIFLSR